jgi:hypothetical protein
MHSRYWTRRCLGLDLETGAWCGRRPTDGSLCPAHAWEFRNHAAAQAATRLARARAVVDDPTTPSFRRRWAAWQVRRARALRRDLLRALEGAESAMRNGSPGPASLVTVPDDLGRWS